MTFDSKYIKERCFIRIVLLMKDKDYAHVSLDPEEVSLLSDREDLTGEPLEKSRIKLKDPDQRADFLDTIKTFGKLKQATIKDLFNNLAKIKKQDIEEAKEEFARIENIVLSALPKEEKERIITMHNFLKRNKVFGCESAYQQAIMKLYNKEVIIEKDSVKFLYAHRELDKQELHYFPKEGKSTRAEDIREFPYTGFRGESVCRQNISQKVLDKKHPSHALFQKAKKSIEKEGKYLATYDSTFAPILDGFTGKNYEKIKAMQYLTGYI